MKRVFAIGLSFLFLLVLLLSFSSCGHEHDFTNGTLVLPAQEKSGVTEIATCAACGAKREVLIPFSKTTEEKWGEMLCPTNYTVTISYGTGDVGTYTVTENGYSTVDASRGFEQYVLKEDDGWYSVSLVEGEYRGHKIKITPDLSLDGLIMPGMKDKFDEFVYSEEWSAYIYVRPGNKYFIYTAKDTLVKIIGFGGERLDDVTPISTPSDEYSVFVFDFHEYGTTELEAPNYK